MDVAIYIIGGLLMLVLGGEALVRSAVSLANRMGIPPMIVGLTIVSIGTSMPEMVVSVFSAWNGHPDIAMGNVIGSNISNILLVLGASAVIYPIATNPDMIKRDGILMVLATVILIIFTHAEVISRTEGMILLAILVAYMVNMVVRSRRTPDPTLVEEFQEETQFNYPVFPSILLLTGGIAMLVWGADMLVEGASTLARSFGITEAVIGVTIVAIGTSAPELVTSVVAALRKHSDIAIGNVIGSNFFNIAGVLGVTAVIVPVPVADSFMVFDVWVMLFASALLIPLMLSSKRVSRVEGGFMCLAFVCYIFYQYTQVSPIG